MADDSPSSSKEADSSNEGSIWRGIKTLIFGEGEQSLRQEIENAINEYDADKEPRQNQNGNVKGKARADLSLLERQMLRNLLHFSEKTVDDVAVPRADIIAVEENASFAELAEIFRDAGHSRIPVYRGTLDTVIGMVHVRDAFALLSSGDPLPKTIESLIRQPLYVPESMGVLDLMAEMRAKRTHLALVLDEYSGTEGLLTFEDLVEEIVGEVEDEHDETPEQMLIALDDGMWDADARAELDDVAKIIDLRLANVEEDVDTLGGLAFVIAGHVPSVGEMLLHAESGWTLEITASDPRRVKRLRLHPPGDENTEESGE
ncbi:MAG: HlyC/CorC family transporter [Sphingobium sp.]|nr:HlyC/CorC family transporter [Sphingobium sp.]